MKPKLSFYSGHQNKSKILNVNFIAKSKSYHFQDMSSSFIVTLFLLLLLLLLF